MKLTRWDTSAVIIERDVATMKKLVEIAALEGVSMYRANLDHASLVCASLDRARLDGASLDRARLDGASLVGARLDGASLVSASLVGAMLDRARLDGASLEGANLVGAMLVHARLARASLEGANLVGATGLPPAPVIANLDALTLDAIAAAGGDEHLDMKRWHTCATTHCRAGWAITLAGEAGAKLERKNGPNVAGALIYHAAYPDLPIPDFMASDAEALADMRARAGKKA